MAIKARYWTFACSIRNRRVRTRSRPDSVIAKQRDCLALSSTMADDVVRIPLEHYPRMRLHHPPVEDIMQEQVRQQWTDDAPLWSSCCARLQPSLLRLHRGLQPALDIKQHPTAVRMFAERLEHKLVIDAVEEPFDVEINDPVGAPAALSCRPDCVDCRSARVGIRTSPHGTEAPAEAPDTGGPLPGPRGRRP